MTTHVPVGDEVPAPPPMGALQRLPLNIAAVFACAVASFYLIERRAIRRDRRFAAPATPGRKDL
jgi:peptidoglycan/LPS O-acetylase OafA/YrhL